MGYVLYPELLLVPKLSFSVGVWAENPRRVFLTQTLSCTSCLTSVFRKSRNEISCVSLFQMAAVSVLVGAEWHPTKPAPLHEASVRKVPAWLPSLWDHDTKETHERIQGWTLDGRAPLFPRFFPQNHAVFRQLLGENPYFKHIFGSGPAWGQNSTGPPLTKIRL